MSDDMRIEPTKRRNPVQPIESLPPDEELDLSRVDSAVSSIEKSKAVRPDMIPAMNVPILIAPTDQDYVVFSVKPKEGVGRSNEHVIDSFILAEDKIKERVLEGWQSNLREIEEQVRQLLASPLYQLLLEISTKGEPQIGSVSGVQGASASSKAVQGYESNEFLSTLSR